MNKLSPLCRVRNLGWAAAAAVLLLVGNLTPAGAQEPAATSGTPVPKKKIEKSADKVKFEVSVAPKEVRRGQTFKLTIKGTPEPGWHTYPLLTQVADEDKAVLKSKLTMEPLPPGLRPLAGITESEPEWAKEDEVYEHRRPFTWSQDFEVLPDARPGPVEIKFQVKMQACNRSCLPASDVPLVAKVDISSAEPVQGDKTAQTTQKEPAPAAGVAPPVTPPQPPSQSSSSGGQGAADQNSGFIAFLLTGVLMGFVSLLTPCVFPMIPITVSFFLKQSEKEHHRPIAMALVYCATIVVVLTIAALALLSFFRWLSINPVMNFVLGGLFVFFALSLFGMYEIELPSSVARFTSSREGRGGFLGTMFMALTFTIISFTCVAPFLGGFGSTAVDANLTFTHRLLGGLAFAVAFASPFFILALFPSLLKMMPRSGAWLNTVKVVMGFLELAAALKFFRVAELVSLPRPVLFTYDLVLGLYVALALLCGLYLLGVYRLPHDSPVDHLGVPRLLFAAVFLGLAFYMAPALFKTGENGQSQRPSGEVFAWLDSFLLPEEQQDSGGARPQAGASGHPGQLVWLPNLDRGLEKARAEKKLVFVDFTGVSCVNCRYNERNVLSRDTVRNLLKKYALVALYTDQVPAKLYDAVEQGNAGALSFTRQTQDAKANLDFQREKFGTESLPLYVILEPLPTGGYREVGRREGRLRDAADFEQFLETPLAMNREAAPAQGTTRTAASKENAPRPVVASQDAQVKLQPAAN